MALRVSTMLRHLGVNPMTKSTLHSARRCFGTTSTTQLPKTMRAVQIVDCCEAKDVKTVYHLPLPEVKPGHVLVNNDVTGLNMIDTYHRNGLYPRAKPFILGVEGTGNIVALGSDVPPNATLNTRVAYYGTDTYAEYTSVPWDHTFEIPEKISSAQAIAIVTQGLTAHYLTTSTFPLKPGHTCIVHAAAGGTGQLIVQMAKILGATVIATASTAEKLEIAKGAGADHLINYSSEDVLEQVMALTNNKGVDVVYDGVGLSTWQTSLECTAIRGMCVYFGNSSGAVPSIDPMLLAKKSVFITRPKLYDYVLTREALCARAAEVIEWVTEGRLKLNVDREFDLSDAAKAHEYIEARKTTGKVVIRV